MSFIKPFLLGFACAYGVQRITKKRHDGTSPLSDFLDNPPTILKFVGLYVNTKVNEVLIPIENALVSSEKVPPELKAEQLAKS